jgi:hypothetical protein
MAAEGIGQRRKVASGGVVGQRIGTRGDRESGTDRLDQGRVSPCPCLWRKICSIGPSGLGVHEWGFRTGLLAHQFRSIRSIRVLIKEARIYSNNFGL